MTGLDFTAALGRLLTERDLRAEFTRAPGEVARRLAARPEEAAALAALDPEGLEAQARTVLQKRLHEVRRLLPVTFAGLGERGRTLFLEYAGAQWPAGHRRHLVDAVAFGRHLRARGVAGASAAELHWLEFLLGKRRLSVRAVRDLPCGDRRRAGLQVLYRTRAGRPRRFALRLGLGD